MQKVLILLGLLLATGGCQGMHHRLVMMEEKKEAGQGGLNTWFESFVDAVDNAEAWDAIATSLVQGKKGGYLDKMLNGKATNTRLCIMQQKRVILKLVKELILHRGVDVDLKVGQLKRTPLQFAASAGHLGVVKFLVEREAAISYMDAQGSMLCIMPQQDTMSRV